MPVKTQKILKDIADECIAVRFRMLNRMITQIFDEALRPFEIKASQLNILVAVATYGPVSSRQLCVVLHMDASTFSRAVSRIKKRGWLDTEPSGEGKILLIRMTEPGIKKIREIYPAWKKAQETAQTLLGKSATTAITDAGNRQLLNGMTK